MKRTPDHISLIDRSEGQNLRVRLATVPPEEVFASIVSYEEQMRGWLAYLHGLRGMNHQVDWYRCLERMLAFQAGGTFLDSGNFGIIQAGGAFLKPGSFRAPGIENPRLDRTSVFQTRMPCASGGRLSCSDRGFQPLAKVAGFEKRTLQAGIPE